MEFWSSGQENSLATSVVFGVSTEDTDFLLGWRLAASRWVGEGDGMSGVLGSFWFDDLMVAPPLVIFVVLDPQSE